MEIYRGTVPKVRFTLPTPQSTMTSVGYSLNGSAPVDVTYTLESGNVIAATLPYQPHDATVKVIWNFTVEGSGAYSESNTHDVVTPLLLPHEIRKIVGEASDEDVAEIEQAVRHIINAHCGQSFGKYVGPIAVTGSGEPNLRLPRRLISYTKVNGGTYWNDMLSLRGGGWFLQSKHVFAPSVRADFDGWHYSYSSPIVAPYSKVLTTFIKNVEYEIDGVWGWEEVPDAVRSAAKLLVNDYACGDSLYRDRFLTSMTAADWRIQFHEGAFSNTGNVRANQLLAEFVLRRGWVII